MAAVQIIGGSIDRGGRSVNKTLDPAAARYLRELDRALADLPRDRRQEIVDEIHAHIEESSAAGDEIALRNVLDALGSPETIAADARERFGISVRRGGAWEAIAILATLIGGVIVPAFGWLVGVVLLWTSRVWTIKDKLVGTLVVPGGLALPLYLHVFAPFGVTSCQPAGPSFNRRGKPIGQVTACSTEPLTSEWWGVALLIVLTLLALATAIYLGRRAFSRGRPA